MVGYQTVSLEPGVQGIKGATFVTVGKDALDIQDIKMNKALADSEAQIWWWDGSKYEAKAFWYTDLYKDETGATTYGYAGWGDEVYWMPVEKSFANGEGFWIKVNGTVSAENAIVKFPNPLYVAP